MLTLIAGLILFFAIHLVPTMPGIREGMVRRFGGRGYQGLFALVSAVGLVAIVYGYGQLRGTPAANPILWTSPVWLRHSAMALMLPAMILLVAAYVPSRIRTMVGHPMLAAVKIWAFAHLLVNGDLASLLLFGSFLAFAVYDRISVKRRSAMGPLGAAKGSMANDIAVLIVGVGIYYALVKFLHVWLIGVPVV